MANQPQPTEHRDENRVLSRRTLTIAALVVPLVTAAAVVLLMWEVVRTPNSEAAKVKLDALRTALNVGVVSGGAFALWLAWRRQRSTELDLLQKDQVATDTKAHQERIAEDARHDATERRITELYTKAADQLGSDKAPVRLAGLYALERLAQDNPEQRPTIVNVICAYLRMPYTPPADPTHVRDTTTDDTTASPAETAEQQRKHEQQEQEKQVRLTAQQVLTTHLHPETDDHGRPTDPKYWPEIDVDLTNATLFDFNLSGCHLHRAEFTRAQFNGDARFDQARFSGRAGFHMAQFSRNAEFSGTQFRGPAGFDRTQFSGTAAFADAQFSRDAGFGGVHFGRTAEFTRAQFNGDARFDGANFRWNAEFSGAQFSGPAEFGGAQFSDMAKFAEAQFNGDARFGWSQFGGEGFNRFEFDKAVFSGYAGFERVQFRGSASFDKTQFNGPARFDKAVFNETAWFEEAQFSGTAWFADAQFNGDARFAEALFNGNARFSKAQFSEEAAFGKAVFSGYARISGAYFKGTAGFAETQFNGYARFDKAHFNGDGRFDEAQFGGTARFSGAHFNGDAWFGRAQFSRIADFGGAQFRGDVLFVGAHFSGDAEFRNVRLAHGADLEDTRARLNVNGTVQRFWPDGWVVQPLADPEEGQLPEQEGRWGVLVRATAQAD